MNKKLHKRQQEILDILKKGLEGLSLRDIASEIGLSSPNTVLHHIKQLEKKGFLRRNPNNPMDFTILADPIKDITYINLYGMAQCGPKGLLAEEKVIDRLPFSTRLFGVDHNVFLIKARGDSMEPYIFENDMVLTRKQPDVDSGELAVVVHNEIPKVKKLIRAGKQVILESLNQKYKPEIIEEDDVFSIIGKVKSVIKFMD